MPTIIDSLLVTLGLDTKAFVKEKAKVDSGLKDTGKTGSESFDRISKSATKFFAVIGGTVAVKRFIETQIEANSALDRFSKNLNENANTISAWSNATELAGGSAQGLQGTMDMLSRAQTELQLTGQSALIPYFSALGMSLADTRGKALPVNDILLELADRFGKMDRTTANNMGRMMGIDQGTLQLLLKGRAEVELMIRNQKEYGAVTKQQVEEATRLRAGLVGLTQGFQAFGRSMMSDAMPLLESLIELFKDFGTWCKENKTFVEAFFTIIAAGLTAIGVAALPVTMTTTAVVGLVAAVAALWQDLKTWRAGGDSFFDWAPAIKAASDEMRAFKELGFWGYLKSGFNDIGKVLTGNTSGSGSSSRQKFIATAAKRLGVPESAIDAQLRLETGATGGSAIGDFNYGNIKAGAGYSGKTKDKSVVEYAPNGMRYHEVSAFRSYSDPEAAGADYAATIARRFPAAVGAGNAVDFAKGLKAGGYATDPNYVGKISSLAAGIAGASQAAMGAGASASAQSSLAAAPNAGNRSVETHIGEVKVYSAAKDADGIAKDMGKSLDYLFTSQLNYGLM